MLKELLRRPQASIARLAQDPDGTWAVPLAGFFFLSFAEGNERLYVLWPNASAVTLILLTAAGALVLGSWMWAGFLGGALHLSARLLGGLKGPKGTIRAVGYALFWPGLVAAVSAALVILLGYRGNELPPAALAPLAVQVCAGCWAVYTTIAALRAHHAFGWGRASLAYVIPFVFIIAAVAVYLLAVGPV